MLNNNNNRMLRVKDKKQVYRVAINAALGSFLFGYQLVNISSLEELFAGVNKTDPEQTRLLISLITAALPLGAIIGSILLKAIMKRMRARMLMILMDVVAVLAMCLQDVSLSFVPLFVGRLILGFVVGVNSGLVPQYIYSVTPTQLAGSVGSLHQVFLMIGVATCYSVGFIILPEQTSDQIRWRIELSLPIITCILRTLLLLFLFPYQIPSYKMKDEQIERLQKYYYKIYENYGGVDTIAPPQQIQGQERSRKRTAQIVCIFLALSNQLCGINAILFYAKQLFMRVTDENNNLSQLIMIGLGVVQIVSTYAGGWLMDKFPKKTFLIGGEGAMAICLFCIFMSSSEGAIILLVFIHTIAYSFSIGQLLMYYPVKMLPSTGVVILVNWFFTFVVALTAEFMMKGLGIGNMCLLFFVLLSLCLVVLVKGIPEEKSMSSSIQEPLKIKLKPEQLQLRTTGISTGSETVS